MTRRSPIGPRRNRILRDGITAFALLAFIGIIALKMNNQPEVVQSGGFYVIDGDTLSREGERFRLIGIDAPEFHQECDRAGAKWACGREARATLGKLMQAGPVECRGAKRDIYHRLLVTCRAGETDMNREMVLRGMAVSYGGYAAEEAQARQGKSGLWAGSFERPQEYRREGEAEKQRDPLASLGAIIDRFFGWAR